MQAWCAICNGHNWRGSAVTVQISARFKKLCTNISTNGQTGTSKSTVKSNKLLKTRMPHIIFPCQVVAFLAAMETIAEQFPGAFSGYRLEVWFYLDNSGSERKCLTMLKVFKLLLQGPVLQSLVYPNMFERNYPVIQAPLQVFELFACSETFC